MNERYLDWKHRFFWLALFAVAMGVLEGIVVVYLRALYYPDGFAFPLKLMPSDMLATEWIREIATLVMLIGVGMLAGRNGLQRLLYALFAFGVWDIVYYAALKLALDWPDSFFTWDVLFLIPMTWLGPVLAPMINSLTMILMAWLLVGRQERGFSVRPRVWDWLLIAGGALLILCTYLADYCRLLIESGVLNAGHAPEAGERFLAMITRHVPEQYAWAVFILGEALIVLATVHVWITSRPCQEQKCARPARALEGCGTYDR